MSYFIKNQIQSDYEKKFDGVTEFVVIDTTGISGVNNNIFRGEMKKKDMHLAVVKNSLMRLTLKKMGLENAGDVFRSGPCVVVYGGDSVIDVAKEVLVWGKKFKEIKSKGAYVDGSVMKGDNAVAALSKMPTRVELQGQIVQIALTPGSNLAGAILSQGSAIAGCLKTMIENKEKEAA